jgi:hypothetical protein
MFCPNCGQDCGTAKFCSECGQDLRKWPQKPKTDPQNEQKALDLEQYYQKYKPDRLQAIMALRIDTGMRAHEAQKIVEAVFDAHESKAHVPGTDQEILRPRTPGFYCPKCSSGSVKTRRASMDSKLLYTGCYDTPIIKLAASLLNVGLVIASKKSAKRLVHICKKCGYQWQSKQE